MADPVLLAKLTATALADEGTRKKAGWVIAAVLSPVILVVAFLCALASGGSSSNASAVELCFNGGTVPADFPVEYQECITDMRASFALLDEALTAITGQLEADASLDDTRVKAIFYALYFGTGSSGLGNHQQFADCFVNYESRTRTVPGKDPDGKDIMVTETYTVAVPVSDLSEVYQRISTLNGTEITAEQQANAESVYNLVRYGNTSGDSFGGADVPFIGADGFCSPVGANWRSIVTSEFGYRKDPFTGQTKGHNGMDLAVPTGTSVRAALPGTVTVAKYSNSYGYYVMIDHGGGLVTLYAHNSKLMVAAGDSVQAGDVVSLSGSTGRSTGPHLHFEVRVNGERTDPRPYLP